MSSPRSRRAPRLVAALALLLASAVPAGATDVKLWPFFRWARDEARGELRWSVLGPLVEYAETPETRELRIRPLISLHQRRGTMPDDRADILYPLASSVWKPDYQSFRFLLFTYRTQTRPTPAPETMPLPEPEPEAEPGPKPEGVPQVVPYSSRLTLFPFVFYRFEPETGPRLSVFPFWLDLDDFFGWSHVRAVMFPAYLELDEPRVERRFLFFPFYSTVGGPDGDGTRVWPFWGREEVAGRERSHYVLWPFHVRNEMLVPGYGWERRRVNFPVWAAIDGAGRTSRAWGVIAYTHTVDERQDVEVTGSPWPLVLRARRIGAAEYYTWRVAPFYGRSDRDGVSSRFWLWPAWREKRHDVEGFHYRRRDALLLLWRRQAMDSEETGRHTRLHTLFPVLRDAQDDGRRFGQAPALLDSLLPENRGVLSLWAPLWAIARWDTRPDGARDWNALFGLVAREGGRLRGPWYLELDDEAADAG